MGDHTQQIINQKYHLQEKLGQGGMGAVYRAQHTVIGKKVAVKILHAEYITNDNVIHRFYREARAAAEIGHKNIIDVMDVGVTDNNEPFIVMEFLEGEGLEHLSKRLGPLDLASVCGIIEPVLQALSAAHAKGIVHRDLKPENIFLARVKNSAPTVKLIDFGISKFLSADDNDKMTRTGTILGTPSYMAPEQARGSIDEIDHRADLWAVGVIIYELLTCALPFDGRNYNELLVRILTEDFADPLEKNPQFPKEALPVIQRALTKSREDRYQSADELLTALRATNPFGDRNASMTQIGNTLMATSYATGDLIADQTGEDSTGASNILASLTPQTQNTTGWSDTSAAAKKTKPLFIAGIGAICALSAGLVWTLSSQPEPISVPPAPAAPAKAPAENSVQISLVDLPKDAAVTYDGMPVSGDSFRVTKGSAIRKLEVRAAGFEPLVQTVVPDQDKNLTVTLKPLAPEPVQPAASPAKPKKAKRTTTRRRRKRATPPKPVVAPKAQPTAAEKNLRTGRRNTSFTDDFE